MSECDPHMIAIAAHRAEVAKQFDIEAHSALCQKIKAAAKARRFEELDALHAEYDTQFGQLWK